MSYYILPKNYNIINFDPYIQKKKINPYICDSLYIYYNNLIKELFFLIDNYSENNENVLKIMNPYEFIFSKIPGAKFSVSKLQFESNIFYDFLEIIYTLNVFENIQKSIQSINFTQDCSSIIECMEIIRDDKKDDKHIGVNSLDNIEYYLDKKYNFIFYDLNKNNYNSLNEYIIKFINFLKFVLKSQDENGVAIVKIDLLIHKPIIDLVYSLTSMYDKVFIIKPNTSNIIKCEKYIVCKGFNINDRVELYNLYYNKLNEFIFNHNKYPHTHIKYVIKGDLPCIFMNKINDMNIIIGQQQLETIDQIINIFKNKNKEIKLDNIKKNNIQKCVHWCEKYKIPCNKFIEKSNIFLQNIIKDNEKVSEV
jgi:hypothetical protein